MSKNLHHGFWRTVFGLVPVVVIGLLLPATPIAFAQSGTGAVHVAASGTDATDCGSTVKPCRTLQYAANIAASGDVIKVAQGIYTGTSSAVVSLTYTHGAGKNLSFIGGYVPPNWNNPVADASQTILDGQNARHGMEIISVPAITVLIQNLTIQNGFESTPIPYSGDYTGGGLVCRNDDPNNPNYVTLTLRNVVFKNNLVQSVGNKAASGGGASLYLRCRATLEDVVFEDNRVIAGNAPDGTRGGYALGGGLFATMNSDVTITRATFTNNLVQSGSGGIGKAGDGTTPDALGGGAAFQLNTVTVNGITAIGNRAIAGGGSIYGGHATGGALFFELNSGTVVINDGLLKNNAVVGGSSNTAEGGIGGGGGLKSTDSVLVLNRLIIVNNSSTGGAGVDGGDAGGGGLYFTRVSTAYPSSVTATNLIVAANTAQAGTGTNRWGGGGGVFSQNTSLTLVHSTLAQNSVLSTMQGPAIVSLNYLGSSSVNMQHSIVALHGNTGAAVIIQKTGDVGNFDRTLFYNNVGGNYGCQPGMSGCSITNTNQVPSGDPAFVSPGSPNFDYRIGSLSAARDKAVGSSTPDDVYKQMRPFNFISDVGAHEYYSTSPSFRLYLPFIIKGN